MQVSASNPMLVGQAGDFTGVPIPIPATGLTLGRLSPGADRLAFDEDSDISRDHCTVRYDARSGVFAIADLGSSNGTFLMPQERRIAPHAAVQCEAGQVIRLGSANVFQLQVTTATGEPDRAPDPLIEHVASAELPRLAEGQRLDLRAIRVPWERFWQVLVWMPAVFGTIALIAFWLLSLGLAVWYTALIAGGLLALNYVSWKLFMASVLGNAVRVGPDQYPQIHGLVVQASTILDVAPPTVMILQGHGIFELFVARRFSRRAVILITSNMLDDLTENGSSREFMFFVGRQLGLIATGYFDYWFFKHTLGVFALFAYTAWCRRCHLTADRLGLLVTGDVTAAEQALLIITAGFGMAANTRMQALREQRAEVFSSGWSWLQLGLSTYPYMVDRIVRLRDFADEAVGRGIASNVPMAVGALPIQHRSLRALPVIIVHGHDITARLELENFLRRSLPHVEPILMIDATDAAGTLPEKFERLGRSAKGALVLLTPDDVARAYAGTSDRFRARQNVIGEMFFFWAKLGRHRLLLLTRGDVELPSDFSGTDVHRYSTSPVECSEVVREFISSIESR